jgi:hypothetical protein
VTYFSQRNLAPTVEARPRYITLPCVPRPNGLVLPLEPDRCFDRRHDWTAGTFCLHCCRSIDQVRVRINPKTSKPVRRGGGLAQLIANTHADVPPVAMVGRMP